MGILVCIRIKYISFTYTEYIGYCFSDDGTETVSNLASYNTLTLYEEDLLVDVNVLT